MPPRARSMSSSPSATTAPTMARSRCPFARPHGLIHVANDTATKGFRELESKGFIKRHRCGSFNWKLRHATTWILTEHSYRDQTATKDFMRWPNDPEPGPSSFADRPKPGAHLRADAAALVDSVSRLGPWVRLCTADRSQTVARMYSATPASQSLTLTAGLVPALWLVRRPPHRSTRHRAVGKMLVALLGFAWGTR